MENRGFSPLDIESDAASSDLPPPLEALPESGMRDRPMEHDAGLLDSPESRDALIWDARPSHESAPWDQNAAGSDTNAQDSTNADNFGGGDNANDRTLQDALAPEFKDAEFFDRPPVRAEICNGIDDDQNGQVDDLDVAGDGICDCLAIATIGALGTWAKGDVLNHWIQARTGRPVMTLGDGVLHPDLLKTIHLLIVQDVHSHHPYSADEANALLKWVQAGGGIFTLIGYSIDANEFENINRLLSPLGVSYGPSGILQGPNYSMVTVTDFAVHPLTNGVRALGCNNGYSPQGDGTIYSRSAGQPVGLAKALGQGRIHMWGDEWITYEDQWSSRPEFQVERYWINNIRWLTPATFCQVPLPVSRP